MAGSREHFFGHSIEQAQHLISLVHKEAVEEIAAVILILTRIRPSAEILNLDIDRHQREDSRTPALLSSCQES